MNNTVEMIGFYGSDESHALSAWTSTSRDMTDAKRARIPALLQQMARAEPVPHRSPFEKSALHFLVTTDVATHIHIIKHRIGVSVNGESARYKEIKEDRAFIPPDWPERWQSRLFEHSEAGNKLYHQALVELEGAGLTRKRAKETARYFKGYNSQMTADVMFNFTSFVNFYRQRADDHAQNEVQFIAREMRRLVAETGAFTHSLEAWRI